MITRSIICSLFIVFMTGCNLLTTLLSVDKQEVEKTESVAQIHNDSELLTFTDFHVNEARFNPSATNPVALTIMSSVTFLNASGERLDVRFPRFKLDINGVYWTDLASTDFQIGRLQANGSQTIELQSLLLMKNATEKQQPVVDAIKSGEALAIHISGTILIFPSGNETVVNLDIVQENLVLPSEWLRPDTEG